MFTDLIKNNQNCSDFDKWWILKGISFEQYCLRHNLARAYDSTIDKIPRCLTSDVINTQSRSSANNTSAVIRPDEAARIGSDT